MTASEVTIIEMDLGQRRSREYLGDGVYVEHDDWQFWLITERAGQTHEIALGIAELASLRDYAQRKTGAKL